MNKIFSRLTVITALLTFSFSGNSSVENLLVGASKKYPFTSLKEVTFELDVEEPGLFGVDNKKYFYKMFLKVNNFDQVEILIQEFSDSSFGEEKLVSFSGFNDPGEEESLFVSTISSIFLGRSIEFYRAYPEVFMRKKIQSDLVNRDMVESVTNQTESKLYKKKALDQLKKSDMQSEIELDGMTKNEESLGGTLTLINKGMGIGFSKLKDDMISGFRFSKVLKEKKASNITFLYDSASLDLHTIDAGNVQVIIDHSSEPLARLYPKHILFSKVDKKSTLKFIEVKNFRRTSLDFKKLNKKLLEMNINQKAFVEQIF